MDYQEGRVRIHYTNHRGETSHRNITPIRVRWCKEGNAYHQGPLHLLDAFDHDRMAERSFAMRDIHGWEELG